MASDSGHNIYGYEPSIPAGVIFILLFAATTGCHVFQLVKARALYFIPFALGGAFQVFGYVFRCLGHSNVDSTAIYAIQTLLILLAPALYAASIYMVLGRLISYLQAEHHSLIRVTWMTKVFVTGDVISFLTQCAGGGLMASSGSRTLGTNLTIVALVIQILFFGFFFITAIVFHVRITKSPTGRSREAYGTGNWKAKTWVSLLVALYIVSILILVRSVFRLIEFIDGYGGYLMTHESFIYIFDTLPMFATMVVMNIYHPGYIIRNRKGGLDNWEEVQLR